MGGGDNSGYYNRLQYRVKWKGQSPDNKWYEVGGIPSEISYEASYVKSQESSTYTSTSGDRQTTRARKAEDGSADADRRLRNAALVRRSSL